LGRILFVLSHFHDFHPSATTHFTCDFISLVDDTHIVGPIDIYDMHICGAYLFMFPSLVCNMRTFHLTNRICNLVSINIRPIHITSTMFSYI
jgi:hypothetical protein